MLIYIGAGFVSALIGFAPFPLIRRFTEANRASEGMNALAFWIMAILLSFVLLVAALFICKKVGASGIVPFGITEVAVFLAAVCIYTVVLVKRDTRA